MSDRNDELSRHLGTLLKTAMAGIGTMRELVVRSTQTGRLRVDIALLAKERSQLLQALGETIVQLVDDGAWPADDVPESVRQAYERIKDVEGQLQSDRIKASDNAFGAPRGYEPEAASDYGPEDDASEIDEHEAEATAPAPRGSRRRAATSAPKRQGRPSSGTRSPSHHGKSPRR